jgi:uncharacterized membrane protein YfcA
MFDFLIAQILVFSIGICAIIFSVLAWRLRKNILFILGLIFSTVYLIYAVLNHEFLLSLLLLGDYIFFVLNLSFIVVPVYFLISSKQSMKASTLDGLTPDGKVTDQYLDDIINAPDEEIDFE